MSYATLPELGAQYQALSRRIEALDRDIGLETDGEKRSTMRTRRLELAQERELVAAALHRGQVDGMVNNSGSGSAADYRLGNTERMLQQADGKLDRMSEQLSDHSSRLRVLEDRVGTLSTKVDRLSGQIDHLRSAPGYSRTALAVGAAVMLVMLVLLLIVTWRLV